MSQSITFDITDHLDGFNKLSKDMAFLVSKSMNDVAFLDSREALSKDMVKSLTIRSKGIASKFMFQVVKSNKQNLEVIIFHKVPGVGLQQHSGTETPKSKKLAIPNRKNMSRYLGVSKNKNIPKRLKIDTIMKKAPRSRAGAGAPYTTGGKKLFILPSGIYTRIGKELRAVYNFVDQATHSSPNFHFQHTMERSYERRFTKRFNINYLNRLRRI